MELKTILCPVDFSDQSQQALRWAIALAARHQSRLIVFTAVDPLLAEAAKTRLNMDLATTEIDPELRQLVETTLAPSASWSPPTSFDIKVGHPADMILDAAGRHHADLIVMGTHGLGGFKKILLGSTTERVLRRTNTPVLGVPLAKADAVILQNSGPRMELERILIGTDFSEASTTALEWAAGLARQFGVPLVICHVVPPMAAPSRWQSHVPDLDEERRRSAQTRLEILASRFDDTIEYEAVVSTGPPADSIASIAEGRQAGLIVVGLVGEEGASGHRPGSIAYRLLSLAHVPTLVVPPATSVTAQAERQS